MENSKILSLISKSDLKKEQKDAILANLGNLILGNSDDRIELDTIVNSDISKEQKDALLGVFADRLINEKTKTSREEIIEKARKQAAANKERLKEYEEKSAKKEQETKYNKELDEKLGILRELKNNNGEKIYANLDITNINNQKEMEELYDNYVGTKQLELAKEAYEQKKLNDSMKTEEETNTNDEEKENNDITLDELETKKDDEEKESSEKDIDLKPEGKKRPKILGQAKEFLKNKINANAGKVVLAIAGAAAALALLVTNFPALIAVAGGAYIGNEFNKGKKL